MAPARDGLLLRLFFGRTLGRERCAALLRTARETAAQKLAAYEELLDRLGREEGHTPDWPYIRITIRAGIHHSRSAIVWADEALAALPAGTDSP